VATSVEPPQFAAATGLNFTARQVGGALGVAALAAILQAQPGGGVEPLLDVLLFSSLASIGVALTGLKLIARAPAASPVGVAR
jgi:hypothetical protein